MPNDLVFRTATIERSGIDEETRTVKLSFSSEFPYARSYGYEILSHRADDVSLAILNGGAAPLLLDHDYTRQIGVIIGAGLNGERGEASIKFSRSALGEEIYQDVLDGVRSNISVGYLTGRKEPAGTINGRSAYRFKWQPYEISVVSLPVDPTVGIGRAEDPIESKPEERNMPDQAKEPENQDATRANTAAAITEVDALCKRYSLEDKFTEFVISERSMDDLKKEVIGLWSERNKTQTVIPVPAPAVHTRQQDAFSLSKAMRAATLGEWDKAGLEREECQQRASDTNLAWDKHTFALDANQQVRTVNTVTGGATQGAELVGTTYMPERLIDALWNKTFLSALGTDSMTGLIGNASFPVISSNAVSVFQGETAALPAAQGLTTGLKSISPKQMTSKFMYSRQMMIQGLPNIEAKILDQLYQSISQKLDQVALTNTGTTLSTLGLMSDITQIVAAGTNGAAPSLALFYQMRKALVNALTFDGNLGWAISGSLNETLHTTLKDATNTNSGYILAEEQSTLASLPLVWSQNIPNNLTKGTGTNLSAAILGDWSQLLIAQWGNIVVQIDPYTAADNSQIVIRSYSFWDMLIKRLNAFVICKDLIA